MPSAKILEQKKAQVTALSEKIKNAKIVFFVDYKGINVEDDRALRKAFREAGYDCAVVKNSIVKLAAKSANVEGVDDMLQGSTIVVSSSEDYTAGAKIAFDFADKHDFYKFKGGIMDGKAISEAEVTKLAKLPSREALLTSLASALIGNIRNLAVVLDQMAKKNEEKVSA